MELKRKHGELQLSMLTILQLLATYLFARVVPAQEHVWAAVFFVILIVATYSLKMLQSFVLLVAGILVSSFVYVAIAWRNPAAVQSNLILQQLIMISVAVVTWGIGILVRHYLDENSALRKRNAELEKISGEVGLLTMTEFISRAELIFSIAKRRSETAVAARITFKAFTQGETTLRPAGLLQIIGQAASQSIRKEFDLVGFLPPGTIYILLQNADEHSVHIVIDRMKAILRTNSKVRFDSLQEDLLIEMRSFGSDVNSFKQSVLGSGSDAEWVKI